MPATGDLTFTINVAKRQGVTEAMFERLQDLTPVFDAFIRAWSRHNDYKFRMGFGKEASGLSFNGEVDWEALTPEYRRSKQRQGFADRLMTRTGELRDVMTDENMVMSNAFVDRDRAIFGSPADEENIAKVEGNWESRQTIFLDQFDRDTIKSYLDAHINGRDIPGYTFASTPAEIQAANNGIWSQNAEFNAVINGSGGSL